MPARRPRPRRRTRRIRPLAILVATRADLNDVTDHLDHLGVAHGPVTIATLGWLLNAPDPDNIQLRFYTAEHHPPGCIPRRWHHRPPDAARISAPSRAERSLQTEGILMF